MVQSAHHEILKETVTIPLLVKMSSKFYQNSATQNELKVKVQLYYECFMLKDIELAEESKSEVNILI